MIQFPGLQLQFFVNPVAFSMFGIPIYWYAICIILAILVSFMLCYYLPPKFEIDNYFLFDTLLYAIIFGVIGARLYYVLFHLEYYWSNPATIFKTRNGGLAIYGGIFVGAFVVFYQCKKRHYSLLDFLDRIAPFVALGQAIGRWGNFCNQEAYGIPTNNFFRMGLDTPYGYMEVHPTFLYESILTCFIFLILRKMQKKRKFQGQITYMYLFLYAGIRMFIEQLRVDSLMVGNFRISQILSIAIFVVFGRILLKKYGKYRNGKIGA